LSFAPQEKFVKNFTYSAASANIAGRFLWTNPRNWFLMGARSGERRSSSYLRRSCEPVLQFSRDASLNQSFDFRRVTAKLKTRLRNAGRHEYGRCGTDRVIGVQFCRAFSLRVPSRISRTKSPDPP